LISKGTGQKIKQHSGKQASFSAAVDIKQPADIKNIDTHT